MRLPALAIVFALAAASCAGGAEIAGDRRIVGDATLSFTVNPSRIEVGKPVRLQLRVTNNGGRPEVLNFSSGQLYDFWVTRGDRELWRWSDDRSFTQALERRTVASQDSITFGENWTTESTGTLTIHGRLLAEGFDRALTGELRVDG